MRKLWLLGATALTTLALEGSAYAVTDEIIVSARKREETLQDVPVSATVLTSEDLDNLVLDDFEDFIRQIPGAININSGPDYLNDIGLRGQGGGRLGFSESATGIYRNGIYIAGGGFGGRSFNRMDLFDLRRVETYRGPQGALYGRNAVGGAINIISQRPKFEDEIRTKVGVGTYNAFDVDAVVNAPATDKLALRAGAFYSEQDGFHKRLEDGTDLDPRQYYGARLGGLLKPWDDGTIVLTLEHFKSQAAAFAATGRVPAKDPSYFLHGTINRAPPADILENSAMLEFEQDLGWADFTAIGTYKFRRGSRLKEDLDHFTVTAPGNNPMNDLQASQSAHYERWGAEVRLASPGAADRLKWLVGADWQISNENVDGLNFNGLMMTPVSSNNFEEELTSYSVFGSVGYDITDQLNLGVELRVLYDEKDFTTINYLAMTPTYLNTSEQWLRPTPAATLTYKINPDHTTYLRFATGYRPGGNNQQAVLAGGMLDTYDPEYTFSYEAGWKANFFGRRLQVGTSAYYAFTNDVQSPVVDDSGVSPQFALVNSGDTNIYGAEVEFRGRTEVLWGDLLGTLGLATVYGEYSDGSSARPTATSGILDLGGARVQRTRDYMVNLNLTYTQPVFNTDWKTSFTASFQAEGGGYENIAGNVNTPAAKALSRELEHFEVVDFRWAFFDEHWRASVFAKNAFNEIYRVQQLSGNDYVNSPQTFGAEVSFNW